MIHAAAETLKENSFPQIVSETLQRSNGMVLVTGLVGSGLEQSVASLGSGMTGRKALVVSSENGIFSESGRARRILEADENRPDGRAALAESRVIFVEGSFCHIRLQQYLTLSEEGRMVIVVQRAPGPITALRRFLSSEFGEGRRHVLARLFEQLLLMTGQMRLAALGEEGSVGAHEILLMTPVLRAALEAEDFEAVEDQLRTGDETSGTVCFNQSLLQLLIRRRIDIKTAFEASRDPIHLDQILKKVGI
jgi:twitching motility protein PilT